MSVLRSTPLLPPVQHAPCTICMAGLTGRGVAGAVLRGGPTACRCRDSPSAADGRTALYTYVKGQSVRDGRPHMRDVQPCVMYSHA